MARVVTVTRNLVLGRADFAHYISRRNTSGFLREAGMKRTAARVKRVQYEPEGSDRRSSGTVSLHGGEWWSAELIVSIHRENEILLTLHHHETAGDDDGGNSVDLCLRPTDLEALPVLLSGVIAQARRDGVLPSAAVVRRKKVASTTAPPLYEKNRIALAPPSVDEPEVEPKVHVTARHTTDLPHLREDRRSLQRSSMAGAPLHSAHAVV